MGIYVSCHVDEIWRLASLSFHSCYVNSLESLTSFWELLPSGVPVRRYAYSTRSDHQSGKISLLEGVQVGPKLLLVIYSLAFKFWFQRAKNTKVKNPWFVGCLIFLQYSPRYALFRRRYLSFYRLHFSNFNATILSLESYLPNTIGLMKSSLLTVIVLLCLSRQTKSHSIAFGSFQSDVSTLTTSTMSIPQLTEWVLLYRGGLRLYWHSSN